MFWALTKKNKTAIYKKWRLDIWGIYTTRYYKYGRKANYLFLFYIKRMFFLRRSLQRFVYYLEPKTEYPPYKRLKFPFFSLRLAWFFYLTVRHSDFKRYLFVSKKKTGSFFSNYALLLEGRLTILLYRMNFISNLFLLKTWVNSGSFLVQGIVHTYHNYNVNLWEIISPSSGLLKDYIFYDLSRRLNTNILFFNIPLYLYVDWFFLLGFIIQLPVNNFLTYPIKFRKEGLPFDILRGSDFFI